MLVVRQGRYFAGGPLRRVQEQRPRMLRVWFDWQLHCSGAPHQRIQRQMFHRKKIRFRVYSIVELVN